jgi:tight adherence protein C
MTTTLIAVFVSVALLTGVLVNWVLSRRAPGRRRLRDMTAQRTEGSLVQPTGLTEPARTGWWFGSGGAGKSAKDMGVTQRNLAAAGYRSPVALAFFFFAEIVSPILFGSIALYLMGTETKLAWGAIGVAAVVGYFVPGLWLESRIGARRKQIRIGLPDVLDLLIVCLEAGSSLDQAILKASEDLDIAYPFLAEELRLLHTEIKAGKPRLEAFRNLAARTKVDEVRSLVGMLVQTDRFGTSVSQALRTFASEQRVRRRQEAEEKAGKVAVKLVFPLVLCMFPALYVIILGSAVIQIVRTFTGPGLR